MIPAPKLSLPVPLCLAQFAVTLTLLATGCVFDSSTSPANVPQCELWGSRAFFQPCDGAELPAPVPALLVTTPGTLDTGNGMLSLAGSEPFAVGQAATWDGQTVHVVSTERFELAESASLRVVGPLPLAIISTGEIVIAGTIDIGSRFDVDNLTPLPGAGADPTSCPDPVNGPIAGAKNNEGGAGGGGGGFGGVGGRGGDGRIDLEPGAPGGAQVDPLSLTLRGGCPGGNGGEGDDDRPAVYEAGRGGPGGGALLFSAFELVTVSGVVLANGAGGRGQTETRRNAGGGGGSGGLIALEGPNVAIADSATVTANGGGGGGGANNTLNSFGEDGLASTDPAQPGTGEGGGTGGVGGAGDVPNGGDALLGADRGGGGGGGAVGILLLLPTSSGTVSVSPSSTRSPAELVLSR